MQILISLVGIISLLGIAVLLSDHRKAIRLHTVGGAFAIQASLGALVLYVPMGRQLLESTSQTVSQVMGYAKAGIDFLFGELGTSFVFAVHVLPVIIFFSSLISVLYYLGIMQKIIAGLGGLLNKVLKVSRAESLCATAGIFVGQTEAPLVIRPYISQMTQSELFAVMVSGLASVAGSVLVGYASIGAELKYLIAASFMAAPGGLLMAKLIKPETETPDDNVDLALADARPVNIIDAAANGATAGLKLAVNVGAMLLAFIALIALLNGIIGWLGGWFNQPSLTLETLLGVACSPLALLIGVPWSEAVTAGSFIGQKLIMNEFVAYTEFVKYIDAERATAMGLPLLSEHSQAIITFALCGFANLSSIAILLGGLGAMAPQRRPEIARFGLQAVAAGTLSNLMSAALAGLFLAL